MESENRSRFATLTQAPGVSSYPSPHGLTPCLSSCVNQRRPARIFSAGAALLFPGRTRMLKLRSIGVRDYSVFGRPASPASAYRASGSGTSAST